MDPRTIRSCTAFAGTHRIASGPAIDVAAAAARHILDLGEAEPVLVFDDDTCEIVELDLRGSVEEVCARLEPEPVAPRAPGRPKLGVVAREVTLLPRHWEWLAAQPGGASVTLRKLVEAARKDVSGDERRRLAADATYRFMFAIAGDAPGFEEATRALFASDAARFAELTESWPVDVRDYARQLADTAFASAGA
jgi:uncharacterized protein